MADAAEEPRASVVQQAPHEAIWVRGDSGMCNLAYARSFAIHKVADGWMVWVHASMRDAKAIPLIKVDTEEQVTAILDQLATLVGALDVRRVSEGES